MKVEFNRRFFKFVKRMGCLSLFAGGICLEYLLAVNLFFKADQLSLVPQGVLFTHAFAGFVTAGGLFGLLPAKYRKPFLRPLAYFFLVEFFIPIVGGMGIFLVEIFGLRRQKKSHGEENLWQVTGQAHMPNRVPVIHPELKFGAHGMQSRLSKSADVKTHLGIVLATRSMREENAVPLLKTALRNPQDDVRLLAFTLLEKKNTDINRRIEHLQKSLERKERSAKIHVEVARNYLRQVTLGLIQDEMKQQVLDLARRHLDRALAEDAKCRLAYFILGQVCLEQKEAYEAELAFYQALELGFAAADIHPFLAQVAFLRREFWKIPEYLRQIPPAGRSYEPLAKVCAYWLFPREEDGPAALIQAPDNAGLKSQGLKSNTLM